MLPIVNPEIYFPQANEDILEMVEQHPGRLRAFCNVDPRCLTNSCDAPLWKVLGHYRDRGCLGVGEIMPTMPMRHPMVQNLLKCAEQVGLPVTWDNSDQEDGDFGLYDEAGLPQLEHSLARFPKLSFIGAVHVLVRVGRVETPGGSRDFIGGQAHSVHRPIVDAKAYCQTVPGTLTTCTANCLMPIRFSRQRGL